MFVLYFDDDDDDDLKSILKKQQINYFLLSIFRIEEYGKSQQQHNVKKQQRSYKNQFLYISTHNGPCQEWNETKWYLSILVLFLNTVKQIVNDYIHENS